MKPIQEDQFQPMAADRKPMVEVPDHEIGKKISANGSVRKHIHSF
jgi:hypothetical protein